MPTFVADGMRRAELGEEDLGKTENGPAAAE